MKLKFSILLITTLLIFQSCLVYGQNVGVLTTAPQAPFHIASSGQVNIPGGLVLLGDTAEGHLQMDFNLLQSMYGESPLLLNLQPDGGDLRVGSDLLQINASDGFIGIGTTTPGQHLDLNGSGNQYLRVHTTSGGSSSAGLELIRSSEFSATDWRIVNEGGILQFEDATDNFNGSPDLNMVMTQSGNVGLGTDSPGSHLHIAGADDQFIIVQRTTSGAGMAGIDLLRANEFAATDWRIVNDGGVLKFYDATDNFTGGGDLNVVMTQGGNVGIGTASPQAPLHIIGSELVNETGDGYLQLGSRTGTHLRFDNNEILARYGDLPSTLFLQYWSGNLSLCFDDDGRVGIGNTSPQAKVHITDGGDASYSNGGELVLGSTSGANLAMDGNEILARNNGGEAPLFLQISGGDILMTPNELGQVGIGVTSSANMPSDDYLLAVDGKIISEEVRVEVSGSWPDYVFAEDYDLMPLQQLEQQITTEKHLPGIPSADVIDSDGIALGEMQKAMMQKIEELTLYVIDLQKQIEELKNANQ